MGTSIRDKARKAITKTPAKVESQPPNAGPKPSTPEPKAPAKVTELTAKEPAPTDREQVASVTAINDHVVDRMTEDEVERFLAKAASSDGVAVLVATRETKTNQIQYDGKTADGYVVRVWAPAGAAMVTKASLDIEA